MTSEAVVEVTLHGQQAVVNRDRSQFRALVTGRRWGKTTLEKTEAMQEFGTPGLVWYLAPTFDMARELMWEPIKAITPRAWLVRDPNETRMELDTAWGCRFACKSVEHPDRLRGRGPRKILGDEFQDWKDGKRTWEEVLLPSLLTSDGTALLTGTPKSFNHLYDVYVLGQTPGTGWRSWQFKTAEAPHIKRRLDYLEQMRREMDPRSFRQEFEASFESLAGRVYYAFQRAVHVKPVRLEPGLPVCVSFDFNVNPATAVIGQRLRDECRVWREVFLTHTGGEATRACVAAVHQALRGEGYHGPVRLYGDASGTAAKTTGPSDHAVVMAAFPGASWNVPSANPHVRDRIAAVNARCLTDDGRTHMVIDPTCQHVVADLEQVIFADNGELDKKSNPLLTHISDALGYWVHQDWPPVSRTAAAAVHMGHLHL